MTGPDVAAFIAGHATGLDDAECQRLVRCAMDAPLVQAVWRLPVAGVRDHGRYRDGSCARVAHAPIAVPIRHHTSLRQVFRFGSSGLSLA